MAWSWLVPWRGTACLRCSSMSRQQLKLQQRAPRAFGECGWCLTSSGHDWCAQSSGAVWSRGYLSEWDVLWCSVSALLLPPPFAQLNLSFALACLVSLMCHSCAAQAERIMEAIELYREEMAKLMEHKAICKAAGKEVKDWGMSQSQGVWVYPSSSVVWVERLHMQIKSGQLDIAKICWNLLENKMAVCPGAWLVVCSF